MNAQMTKKKAAKTLVTPDMEYFIKESLKLKIQSFELRNMQSKAFQQANDIAIMSLNFELNKNFENADASWKDHLIKRQEAYDLGAICDELVEKSNKLRNIYDDGLDYIEQNIKS